jgi:phytoene dehydrogenase-like protein
MTYDAVIVGAGPNGLAAGITLARAGKLVLVLEAKETIGGGTRSAGLTLPGFVHDICSALHPLGVASPFFRDLPLAHYGLEWVFPPASLAHPLDDDTAVLVEGSVDATAANLGPDAARYRRLMGPLVAGWQGLLGDLLGPLRIPRHPMVMARFGLAALLPAVPRPTPAPPSTAGGPPPGTAPDRAAAAPSALPRHMRPAPPGEMPVVPASPAQCGGIPPL